MGAQNGQVVELPFQFGLLAHEPLEFFSEKRLVAFGRASFFCVSAICVVRLVSATLKSMAFLVELLVLRFQRGDLGVTFGDFVLVAFSDCSGLGERGAWQCQLGVFVGQFTKLLFAAFDVLFEVLNDLLVFFEVSARLFPLVRVERMVSVSLRFSCVAGFFVVTNATTSPMQTTARMTTPIRFFIMNFYHGEAGCVWQVCISRALSGKAIAGASVLNPPECFGSFDSRALIRSCPHLRLRRW